jgi:hypothetical protein
MNCQLEEAFIAADKQALETTSCPTLEAISNGWCDVWAKAVKQHFPEVEVRERSEHWFVVFRGAAYDSDTWSDGGFEPF